MSIYSALSMDIPTIVYSIVHQMKKGAGEKEYTKTIRDMHSAVRTESSNVGQAWEAHVHDIVASSVQATRGNLSQFLTLPLDTDVKEVQKILEDQLSQLLHQALPSAKMGILASTEGKFIWEREQTSLLQSVSRQGKEHLAKLKFRPKDEDSLIFESDYFVPGGLNLDILEHIVKDRMGIYNTPHGSHIRQTDPYVFAAHNLVYRKGPLETGESKFEAVLHFSKGKMQYAPFRKGLIELLESAGDDSHLSHSSLWQRKLGLGSGTEFNIRMRARDRRLMKESIAAFVKRAEKNPDLGPAIGKGGLLIKELLY